VLEDAEMIDNYEKSRKQDKALNDAILQSDISLDFLPFIGLCGRYYADEVDLTVDTGPRRTIARDTLEGMLMDFLFPIHLISEMGGVRVSVEASHIPSDSSNEQHSSWFVELLAKNGTRHTISWKTMRTWIEGKVVAEWIHDQSHEGPVIQYSDLELTDFGFSGS